METNPPDAPVSQNTTTVQDAIRENLRQNGVHDTKTNFIPDNSYYLDSPLEIPIKKKILNEYKTSYPLNDSDLYMVEAEPPGGQAILSEPVYESDPPLKPNLPPLDLHNTENRPISTTPETHAPNDQFTDPKPTSGSVTSDNHGINFSNIWVPQHRRDYSSIKYQWPGLDTNGSNRSNKSHFNHYNENGNRSKTWEQMTSYKREFKQGTPFPNRHNIPSGDFGSRLKKKEMDNSLSLLIQLSEHQKEFRLSEKMPLNWKGKKSAWRPPWISPIHQHSSKGQKSGYHLQTKPNFISDQNKLTD